MSHRLYDVLHRLSNNIMLVVLHKISHETIGDPIGTIRREDETSGRVVDKIKLNLEQVEYRRTLFCSRYRT